MRRRILYITAFCIYIGAILYLCLTKPDNLPQTELLIFGLPADKVAHFTMFLPFPILIYLIFFDRSQNSRARQCRAGLRFEYVPDDQRGGDRSGCRAAEGPGDARSGEGSFLSVPEPYRFRDSAYACRSAGGSAVYARRDSGVRGRIWRWSNPCQ